MKKKSVFITGASRGIGEATLYEFARAGWKVGFSYCKNKTDAVKVANRCKEFGASDVFFVKLNLLKNKDIEKLAKEIGHVDVLINNAGFLHEGAFEKETFEDIEREVRTNLEGLMKVTHKLLPFVREQIVNIASHAGQKAHAGHVSYCATKFGVRGFTQAIADEIRRIKFIVINPGVTATRLTKFKGVAPEKVGKIIFDSVVGKIKVKSGGDVDVWKMIGK